VAIQVMEWEETERDSAHSRWLGRRPSERCESPAGGAPVDAQSAPRPRTIALPRQVSWLAGRRLGPVFSGINVIPVTSSGYVRDIAPRFAVAGRSAGIALQLAGFPLGSGQANPKNLGVLLIGLGPRQVKLRIAKSLCLTILKLLKRRAGRPQLCRAPILRGVSPVTLREIQGSESAE
jgi:hypothetical protein